MLNALQLLTACSLVSGGHASTAWHDITDVGQFTASSLGTNITYLNDEDGSLRIILSFNNYGCGGTSNFFAALITDSSENSTWDRVRYRMDFYGTTICYSIFDNTWYGDSPWSGDNICGANGQSFGLFPFDKNIDLVENGLTIGDAWTGRSRHCGGDKSDNLWIGDGGGHRNHDGFVRVELRRQPYSGTSGLYVGASCTVGGMWLDGVSTPVDAVFSEIKVGYDYDDQQVMNNQNGVVSSAKSLGDYIEQYQDELVGALLAFNIITMVGVACYLLAGRCSRRKYVVVDEQEVDDENEKLSF